jgi:hypothetical protein
MSRRRRKAEAGGDYLPGFADALSNVLLALLLVVGVIAMGLVSLNLEITKQALALAEARAKQIILERARARSRSGARARRRNWRFDSPTRPGRHRSAARHGTGSARARRWPDRSARPGGRFLFPLRPRHRTV